MRILITNFELDMPSGTTVYVRDLALELQRRGHEPLVYAPVLGVVARELSDAGICVTRRLRTIRVGPDVIHGHHWLPARSALRAFPAAPAIYVCHNHTHFLDGALLTPQIRQYFGVSQLCVDRLTKDGVPERDVRLLYNFVDTRRFITRDGLPVRARRALIFSNYADAGTHVPAVTEACRQAGLDLDVIGTSAGNPTARPESVLGRYDIVFAKAKAAMEAMATGAAVVLCDFGGVGPAVSSANFDRLRRLNFGFQALVDPLTAEAVLRQIRLYDPKDAARVCAKLRSGASLEAAVEHLCEIYKTVIGPVNQAWDGVQTRVAPISAMGLREEIRAALFVAWMRSPGRARSLLKRMPGVVGNRQRLQRTRL
jgi:hypothetical protein